MHCEEGLTNPSSDQPSLSFFHVTSISSWSSATLNRTVRRDRDTIERLKRAALGRYSASWKEVHSIKEKETNLGDDPVWLVCEGGISTWKGL